MEPLPHTQTPISWKEKAAYWIVCLALVSGFVFSVISSLGLCDTDCNETKYYRFFGYPFAFFGLIFFGVTFLVAWVGQSRPRMYDLAGCMIGAAAGAEIWFLWIQKFVIGSWCPVCVTIAGTVGIAGCAYFGGLVSRWFRIRKSYNNKEEVMKIFGKGGIFIAAMAIGFFLAFTGISKPNFALRTMDKVEEKIAFGSQKSPITVYFFSDWFCSACKKIEPEIEKLSPLIMGKAKVYFIDYSIDPSSQNFSVYNLAFMANDKNQYMKARHLLTDLTRKTRNPTETQVRTAAKKQNIPYVELPFSEVRAGIQFFEQTADKYNIQGTPTMLILNTRTGKKEELRGAAEISQQRVIDAINSLMK